MQTPLKTDRRADFTLLALTAFWGVSFTIVKGALDDSDPFTFLACRFVTAGLAVSLLVVQVKPVAPAQSQNVDQQRSVQEAFEIMASSDNSDSDSSTSSSASTSWQDSSL